MKWEYTVIPSHEVQRFACVSDRDEFGELVSEIPSTATWYLVPRPGFDAAKKGAFELVQYTIEGIERLIRRTERKTGQTYSVSLGHESVAAGKPVRISYTYKTITQRAGHLLHFDIDQPTKGMSVTPDYSDSDISRVSVLDLIASTKHAQIERTPVTVPGKFVTLSFDWRVFPRTGIAFVWT
ncbi:hypothetical protein [Arthrobacter sp. CJ23]|uniref:hypothetical protein n=1 Tax=Arthrobacter sp. CJ23 TaxID=2972479 RepID=UPI00215CAD6B|nr:hypothetical protein [Arthrobacter sp. CJ23]UVJ38048.1 hypothetical protein NVV90_12330 [Arthrobacter sp. CJ23]